MVEKTAEMLAKEHGVNERTVRRAGKRAEALDKLAETAPAAPWRRSSDSAATLTPSHVTKGREGS